MTDRVAVVIGCAPCWPADLGALDALLGHDDYDACAVNGAGWHYLGRIAYWVSAHGLHLVEWLPLRAARGGNQDYRALGNFAPHQAAAPVERWQRPNRGGSSALLAVEAMLELGHPRVVLVGCPLEGDRRRSYGEDGGPGDTGRVEGGVCVPNPDVPAGYAIYRSAAWGILQAERGDRVRSMSGWTSELFGVPTAAWLRGETCDE